MPSYFLRLNYAFLSIPPLWGLQKMPCDRAQVIFIMPRWTRQFWFPLLLNMSAWLPISISSFWALLIQENAKIRHSTGHSSPHGLIFGWAMDLECSCFQNVQVVLTNSRKHFLMESYLAKWKCFLWGKWLSVSWVNGYPWYLRLSHYPQEVGSFP